MIFIFRNRNKKITKSANSFAELIQGINIIKTGSILAQTDNKEIELVRFTKRTVDIFLEAVEILNKSTDDIIYMIKRGELK